MSHPHHPPLIELRDVSRRYVMGHPEDENAVVVPALQGVSLAIEAGEYVAVIGQSGSGKSTLMNMLGCLDRPSEGAFLIVGQGQPPPVGSMARRDAAWWGVWRSRRREALSSASTALLASRLRTSLSML
ncbi:MAG: ATP-binding cassette domain-containing protein, partial [Burkholderiaceae bacterium]